MLQSEPGAVMGTYWAKLELSFVAGAFEWDPDEIPEGWGEVAGWHGAATSRGAIRPASPGDAAEVRSAFDAAVEEAPHLDGYLDHHRPFYEKLRDRALRFA